MNDFDSLFPNFASQCAEMNRVLLPVAFVLLIIGIVSSTVTGQRSPSAYLRTFGRTLAYLAVLTQLSTWGNQVSAIVDDTVRETLKADPAGVYDQYQKKLAIQKADSGKSSWLGKLFDGKAMFETLVSWFLYVLGFLGSVIVFYAYLVQKFVLYLGYALAPIFVGFLAVRTLQSIGVSYLLGLSWSDALAAGMGRGIHHDTGPARLHDGSKLLRFWKRQRSSGLYAAKFDRRRSARSMANLQHDCRTARLAKGTFDWSADRASLGGWCRDGGHCSSHHRRRSGGNN